MQGKQPCLRDQVRTLIRVDHYSIRTEKTYWYWIRYFIRLQNMKHPRDMGPRDVIGVSGLASGESQFCGSYTKSQALNSLVILYNKLLDNPLGDIGTVVRSKKAPEVGANT